MSTPFICNRSPAPGGVAKVDTGARFSARIDSGLISRADLNFHVGTGPAFWTGGALPEDHESVWFRLMTRALNETNPATRSIDPGTDELILAKLSPATVQAGLYFFGGLQAPAAPEDPLMLEFTLKLADGDVGSVGPDFVTGVEVGVLIDNSGAVIRFMRNSVGPARWIEVHTAAVTGFDTPVIPNNPNYTVAFDWDQGVAHTYKLLWQPTLDRVRLYVSTGQDALTNDLAFLPLGKVSDFPTLDPEQWMPNQPWAFFGHGQPGPTSTSRWSNAYLYNIVTTPVFAGVFTGEHTGEAISDDVIHYDAPTLPVDALSAWVPLPALLGTIEGSVESQLDRVVVRSAGSGTSYGFYRVEPRLASSPVMLDFRVACFANRLAPGTVHAGPELFVDDGVRSIQVCFLYAGATQYVGLLRNAATPELITAYTAQVYGWNAETTYRLIVDAANDTVRLVQMTLVSGEMEELVLVSTLYSLMPTTRDPAPVAWTPSLGFLINGVASDSTSELKLWRLRYSTGMRLVERNALPAPPWGTTGTGTATVVGTSGEEEIELVATAGGFYYRRAEATLSSASGATVECQMRLGSYEIGGVLDPIRSVTGVGVSIDDGSQRLLLVLAEAGPPLGKIIFLATMLDLEENLNAIRRGDTSVAGTYTSLDWTTNLVYRIERTVGAGVKVLVNDEIDPVLRFEEGAFNYLDSEGSGPRVSFGALNTDLFAAPISTSYWRYFRYSISSGVDVSATPVLSENEILARFNHAVDVIGEG